MDESHREGDDQKTFSSNLTTQSSSLETTATEGVSSTSEDSIGNPSSSTENPFKVSVDEESSISSEQLLKISGNEKSSTSSEAKTGSENPSSSAVEPSEVFEKETPSSSSDLNPSSSTEELCKIFKDKTSFMSSEVSSSSSAEELPPTQENQIPSAKQLSKLHAKGRMTALPKEISSSSDNDKPSSPSDDVSSVDENFSDRKETRMLPPFLKRNSRRSPELWKYTKPTPTRGSAVPAATESEIISSSASNATSAQGQCDHSFASPNLGKNAETRKTASKRKSPATKNAYSLNSRCNTCGADPGVRSPLIIIRYRNKRLLAARKGILQSKIESNRLDVIENTGSPQAETAAQSNEMITEQQEEDKNEKPKKTQKQINYEIMNQQVLDFFNRMQDYAEEDAQQPTPRAQQNQGDVEDDDIFEMEDIN